MYKPNKLASYKGFIALRFRDLIKNIKKQRDAYPVIVFALLPSLVFWTRNNIQELTPSLMFRVLVFACIVGLFIYGALYILLGRDKYKASVLALITIVITFSYGQLHSFYAKTATLVFGTKTEVATHPYFMLILLIVYLGIAILIKRKVKFSKPTRSYLTLFATALLIFNLYPLAKHWIKNYGLSNLSFGTPVQAVIDKANGDKPDIYYLIFDRYANESVLKDEYKFDNSPFLDSLKNKDFYVASKSTANYPFTNHSLASSLNLDYLPEKFQNRPENGIFISLLHDKIENSQTQSFLKNQGYTLINIGPWWNATKYNKNADLDLYNPTGPVLFGKEIDLYEHELVLFEDTILWPFFKSSLKIGDNTVYGLTYPTNEASTRAIHRQTNLHQFEMVKQASNRQGPKFVFAHFLLPHEPYIFNEKCEPFKSSNEYFIYLKQLQCTNKNIQKTVDYILSHSQNDPVIIIQADEGPYPAEFRKNKDLEWRTVADEVLHQKAKILNAYYFPDRNYSQLQPNFSPVNTFRLVFNQYLGTELPLLENRYYFPESRKRLFHFFEVTEKFKN